MKFKNVVTCKTSGDGHWSNTVKVVPITRIALRYISEDRQFGELCVFFDKYWNPDKDGLIYTDPGWLADLKTALVADANFSVLAATGIDYSEQGLQGDTYVSLDVDEYFLKEWFEKEK